MWPLEPCPLRKPQGTVETTGQVTTVYGKPLYSARLCTTIYNSPQCMTSWLCEHSQLYRTGVFFCNLSLLPGFQGKILDFFDYYLIKEQNKIITSSEIVNSYESDGRNTIIMIFYHILMQHSKNFMLYKWTVLYHSFSCARLSSTYTISFIFSSHQLNVKSVFSTEIKVTAQFYVTFLWKEGMLNVTTSEQNFKY